MRPDNETCVQRVRLFFYYYRLEVGQKDKFPWEIILKLKEVKSSDVRNLKDFLALRLERIASMMDILCKVHEDWAITARKEYISMETESLDYNKVTEVLSHHGYNPDEYKLVVEYTRKWGVL